MTPKYSNIQNIDKRGFVITYGHNMKSWNVYSDIHRNFLKIWNYSQSERPRIITDFDKFEAKNMDKLLQDVITCI